jgi:pyridinium-3,5-biscarboxylic acid mononucleotide synthase
MSQGRLLEVLARLSAGELDVASAATQLEALSLVDLGFARVDTDRERRQGAPEVIYGAGKTPADIAAIARALLDAGQGVLVTRCPEGTLAAVRAVDDSARYEERGRTLVVQRTAPARLGTAALLCAGTSDLPVAEECAATLAFLGIEPVRFYDVGVAGIARLLRVADDVRAADVVIVVAGMDGALPSVVGGLVDAPVIAVPTSVGYGASFSGVAALLTMLNSCSAGLSVVNIDNGFGAARAAHRILRARR